jgi:preprotein translocase SecE subunit
MALGQQPRKPMANTGDNTPAPVPRLGRGFVREVIVELNKTTWPTLPEAWRLTTVVLGVIVAMAVYVGTIDAILSFITNRFHLIK